MKHFIMAATCVALLSMVGTAQAATVDWVGGVGSWYLGTGDTVWDSGSGGDDAIAAFGDDDGWTSGAVIDPNIVISAGDDVFYEAGGGSDWRMDQNAVVNGGTLTISAGGKLTINASGDADGEWTQFDAESVLVTGAGSVLAKTLNSPDPRGNPAPTAVSGGAFILGSFRGFDGQVMTIDIADGGRLENDGQLHLGWWDRDEGDLDVTITVDGASEIDLTGGDNFDILGGAAGGLGQTDLLFHYSWDDAGDVPQGESYVVNFTDHAGTLTVDRSGILVPIQTGATGGEFDFSTLMDSITYEDLWYGKDRGAAGASIEDVPAGILQGTGLSGATGDFFGDHFVVSGTTGSSGGAPPYSAADDNYKLTSIQGAYLGGSLPGDINGDLAVDAADFGTLAGNFGTGTLASEGDINSAVGGQGDDFVDAADIGIMFGGWTGDSPSAGAGTAAAHYDAATGEIEVDVNGVVNWYVEQVGSQSMTGDAPAGLPLAPGLVTDNDTRIGESAFAPFSYSQNLGNVAATGILDDGSLQIFWNESLGGALQSALVHIHPVPEPTTLALAGLALCGVMASRRRR